MDRFHTAEHVAAAYAPSEPVVCHRPHAAVRSARWFMQHFPGTVFYAVKANPSDIVLDAVAAGGVTHFDVASIAEVRKVRGRFPLATLAFMHPVKPAESIREAYFDHGVRIFSLDTEAELHKILVATDHAQDLTLCVRLAVDNPHAKYSLAKKFGARDDAAVALLRRTRLVAQRVGICFHPGSQTMNPSAYRDALEQVQRIVVASGVMVDVVDVGGGFPAPYPGMEPPALEAFTAEIGQAFDAFLSSGNAELWAEPGRALCAEAASLLVRVDGRRDQDLYINDGVYGSLFDAGHFDWRYPVRGLSRGGPVLPFRFYGPTCDDIDMMAGPFFLPAATEIGDFIEIGNLGAYGRSMAGSFNGFGAYTDVICTDDPFGSIYQPSVVEHALGAMSARS